MLHSIVLTVAALTALSVNGLVVDREGFGIRHADVVFRDAAGVIADTTTDEDGRFRVVLARRPTAWDADASGYKADHLRFSNPLRLTAVLQPSEPGFTQPIGADDLGVLPYQDVGYALSLAPYEVLIGGSQVAVGDRGLGGSANIAIDNGTSVSAPARYLSFVGVASASSSYGFSRSASGRFDLGFDSANAAVGTIGSGSLQLVGVQARLGDEYVAFGESSGDTTTQSRFNIVARTSAGKARVLFTAGAGSFDTDSSPHAVPQSDGQVRLRVELPLGSSIARVELASGMSSKTAVGKFLKNGSSADAKAYLRHTGRVLVSEYGVEQDLGTGIERDIGNPATYTGTVRANRVYTTQQISSGRLSVAATLSSYALSSSGSTKIIPANAQAASGQTVGASAQWTFDPHLQLAAEHGENEDSPGASLYFTNGAPTLMLDLSRVNDATLSYRNERGFVASATWAAERYVSYLGTTTLFGRGLSVDWPVGDRWRLRAWTFGLNDQSAAIPSTLLGPSHGRDVGWLTYYASPRVRFDVIYRRETDPIEAGRYVDGDAAFVLNRHVLLVVTRERHASTSSAGLSLRFASNDDS